MELKKKLSMFRKRKMNLILLTTTFTIFIYCLLSFCVLLFSIFLKHDLLQDYIFDLLIINKIFLFILFLFSLLVGIHDYNRVFPDIESNSVEDDDDKNKDRYMSFQLADFIIYLLSYLFSIYIILIYSSRIIESIIGQIHDVSINYSGTQFIFSLWLLIFIFCFIMMKEALIRLRLHLMIYWKERNSDLRRFIYFLILILLIFLFLGLSFIHRIELSIIMIMAFLLDPGSNSTLLNFSLILIASIIIANALIFMFFIFSQRSFDDFYFGFQNSIHLKDIPVLRSIIQFLLAIYLLEKIQRIKTYFKSNKRIAKILRYLVFLFLLCILLPIESISNFIPFSLTQSVEISIYEGWALRIGIICILSSISLIFMLILYNEDIIIGIDRFHIKKPTKSKPYYQIVTGNKNLDILIKKKNHPGKNSSPLPLGYALNTFQSLLNGIDGLLVGSIPIMLFGVSIFFLGVILSNIKEPFDFFPAMITVTTIYSVVIVFNYQSSRRKLLKKISSELKRTYDKEIINSIAKNLEFYLDKPDLVKSTIVLILPFLSLFFKLLSDFLRI